MECDIRIEQQPAGQPLAVVRRLAKQKELPRIVPECCGIVANVLRAKGIKLGPHVAVYLDGEMNVEVGVVLDAPFAGDGEVVGSTLPAGTIVTTTHFGPYQQLRAAHSAIRDWCKQNGREFAGPSWEIYGHWETAWNNSPSLIRTDIAYLLSH